MRRLLRHGPAFTLDQYVRGLPGGRGLTCARRVGPAVTVAMLAGSGLRDRHDARPTGRRWRESIGAGIDEVRCDAVEDEPGTFGTRALLRANPYQVLEGLLVAAATTGARRAVVAVDARADDDEYQRLRQAVRELHDAGLVEGCDLVIEADDLALDPVASDPSDGATDRVLVHDPETLAHIADILARGAGWFRSKGTEDSPGTTIVTVVGDVARPGVGEVELGTTVHQAIARIGGMTPSGRPVKAVLVGARSPVLTADDLATPLSFEGLAALGVSPITRGLIVLDDSACMVDVATGVAEFHAATGCGGRCVVAGARLAEILGTSCVDDVDAADLNAALAVLEEMGGLRCCSAPTDAERVVTSMIRAFPRELTAHFSKRRCSAHPRGRRLLSPIVEIHGATAHHAADGDDPAEVEPAPALFARWGSRSG